MSTISLLSPEIIERALVRSRRPSFNPNCENFTLSYRAANGRTFEVLEFTGASYFLTEPRPDGRIHASQDQTGAQAEPELRAVLDDPGALFGLAREMGVEASLVLLRPALGTGTMRYQSLDLVAHDISEALSANHWIAHMVHETAPTVRLEKLSFAEYRDQLLARIIPAAVPEQAEPARPEGDIFRGFENLGGPQDQRRLMILSYLNDPTEDQWNRIFSIRIKDMTTLWKAWTLVDEQAHSIKRNGEAWQCIPAPDVLRLALRHAADLKAVSATRVSNVVNLKSRMPVP